MPARRLPPQVMEAMGRDMHGAVYPGDSAPPRPGYGARRGDGCDFGLTDLAEEDPEREGWEE